MNKKEYDRNRYLIKRDEILKRTNEYNKNHRKEANERTRRWQLKLKTKVINYYSNKTMKCNCCGESELIFLTIDHINGGGNKHRKEIGMTFYVWLVNNNYPKEFQVLCMNCNWGRRFNKECPHKNI